MDTLSRYFNIAHRNNAVAHDFFRLKEYKALFKHAAIFNRSVLVANHMVVNAPNFRIAYHDDEDFRRLIHSGIFHIASFEADMHDGHYFDLKELRGFYARYPGLLHPDMPMEFQTDLYDRELDQLQSISIPVPDCASRDIRFTDYVNKCIEEEYLKKQLGGIYRAYDIAFRKMMQELADRQRGYGILGIIHFDPSHTHGGTKNIFRYMEDDPFFKKREMNYEFIVSKFGNKIALAHRSILLRIESELVSSNPILQKELKNYAGLIVSTKSCPLSDLKDVEVSEFPISLLESSIDEISSLECNEIINYRKAGNEYFSVMENLSSEYRATSDIARVVKEYVRNIDMQMSRRLVTGGGILRKTANYLVRVTRGPIKVAGAKSEFIGTIVSIGAYVITNSYSAIAGLVAKGAFSAATKIADTALASHLDQSPGPTRDVDSKICFVNKEKVLVQYD